MNGEVGIEADEGRRLEEEDDLDPEQVALPHVPPEPSEALGEHTYMTSTVVWGAGSPKSRPSKRGCVSDNHRDQPKGFRPKRKEGFLKSVILAESRKKSKENHQSQN